jgi:trafficking protein particle complex subunit 10
MTLLLSILDQGVASPQEKLKEALSKPEAFLKVYLEFSELAISTYKHIGQFRYARLIGRELAFLYMYVLLTIAQYIIELIICFFFQILTITGR